MSQKRKLPRSNQNWVQLSSNFVKQWPEVLEGLELSRMPVHYVDKVSIILKTNITITSDVKASLRRMSNNGVADLLKRYLNKHYSKIKNVDLQFNVNKLKKDMNSKTNNLLSKTFGK